MPFHVTYSYNQPVRKQGGWSENFWSSAGTLDTAVKAGAALRPLLQALHGQQTNLTEMTVKDASASRISKTVVFDPGTIAGTSNEDSDYPTVALLLKMTNATGDYFTKQWIKGIPDEATKRGVYFPGNYNAAVNAFLKYLGTTVNGWVMRVRKNKATIPAKNIESVTNLGVIGITAHGYVNDEHVRIARVGGVGPINGDWQIYNVTPDTFQLRGFKPLANPEGWDGKGTARKIEYTFPEIKLAELLGISSRKVGRPRGGLSGRQRRVKT